MFNLLPQIQQKIQQRIAYEVLKRISVPATPAVEHNGQVIERPYGSTRIGFGARID
jgi:hypothetical protein